MRSPPPASRVAEGMASVVFSLATVRPSRVGGAETYVRGLLKSFRELSPYTVKSQTHSIYRKLGVSSRSGAVARAREIGLLQP